MGGIQQNMPLWFSRLHIHSHACKPLYYCNTWLKDYYVISSCVVHAHGYLAVGTNLWAGHLALRSLFLLPHLVQLTFFIAIALTEPKRFTFAPLAIFSSGPKQQQSHAGRFTVQHASSEYYRPFPQWAWSRTYIISGWQKVTSGREHGSRFVRCPAALIVAKCPGMAGTVPEFMSRSCPGLQC